jgi:hypothetical protein
MNRPLRPTQPSHPSVPAVPGRLRGLALLIGFLALGLLPGPVRGDDRDLLRRSQQNPYVFVLLDISGSMHLSIPCDQQDFDAGNCSLLCPTGECLPHAIGDDPNSRLRVAKEAIYEIMEQTDNVHFGFGTFDQDGMRVLKKHWWYRVADAADQAGAGFTFLQLDSGREYPPAGHEEVFGEIWSCTAGPPPNDQIGCSAASPADLDDPWEAERVRRWPKLDQDNDTTRTYFIRDDDVGRTVYRVTFTPLNTGSFASQTLGDDRLTVQVRVERCDNNNCTSRTDKGTRNLVFEKTAEFIHWESSNGRIERTPPNQSFFGPSVQQVGIDLTRSDGLEPNDDSGFDDYNGYSFKQPTRPDPFQAQFLSQFGRTRGAAYTVGDLIPFDWLSDQRELIERRMAPNLEIPGQTDPEFGIAPYFNDFQQGGDSFLRLKDARARPFVYHGRTPTGKSMEDFRIWFTDWLTVATDPEIGDPDLACRSFNLVVVTDGLATDGDSACGHANQLRNFVFNGDPIPVRTFAVALGNPGLEIPSFNNILTCVTDNGGTGAADLDGDGEPDGPGPLFPDNKQELIQAFREIFDEITADNRSFAAAAVPQAQANTADKIFLTSFTPVPDLPIWAGRIDGYVRPIPLKEVQVSLPDGTIENRLVPNRDLLCTGPDDASCRVWDAGEELLALAPDVLPSPAGAPLTAADFQIGTGFNDRRVFRGVDNGAPVPAGREFFAPPTTDPGWESLLATLGICDPTDAAFATCAADTGRRLEADAVFRLLYGEKQFRNPETGNDEPFVLGDIFHSNPKVLGAPGAFQLFAGDLFGNGQPCDATGADFNRGYRCFFQRHQFRRNVLLVGANDGQVHGFDAGVFRRQGTTTPVRGDFDNGSGRELFAFVPSGVMSTLRQHTRPPSRHEFTVDGSLATGDVFIDPDHAGVPTDSERRWRSVAIGGLREGGTGYYALDLTQPDTLDTDNVPQPGAGGVVPSCELGGSGCGANPWPSVLWEFFDDQGCDNLADGRCDDEVNADGSFGNGLPDLADTWSVPNLGMIEVCEAVACDADNLVRKFVAVFGGGLDPERKHDPVQGGNWLYMVDIETGKVLYKRELEGSTPSTPAAVDTNRDGLLDTVYIGTVKGLLYKVDLSTPVPLVDDPTDSPDKGARVTDSRWDPFPIFTTDGRPIYFPPSVIFVAARGQFALAFGTGDREDLWEDSLNDDGRFYLFVDDDIDAGTIGIPFDQGDLRRIDLGAALTTPETDFLLAPDSNVPGWFLPLENDERVITQAFALGGVTVFSSFVPQIETSTLAGNEVVCANRGESRVYVLFTTNANAVFDTGFRFRGVPDLVTEPFTEVGQIKNAVSSGNNDPTADDLSQNLREVMETLKTAFPASCRFANFTINVKALRSDTGVEFIAPVPVCITQRNWKEQ